MANDSWQQTGRRLRRRGARQLTSRGARKTGLATLAAAYLADDLRDPEGLARPVLRRAARSLAASRLAVLRKTGATYLRLDPPPPGTTVRSETVDDSLGGTVIEGTAIDVTDEQDAG